MINLESNGCKVVLSEKGMGDYLYNNVMGPWACVSVCQGAWSTDGHTEANLFSLPQLHILSCRQNNSFKKFLRAFFSTSVVKHSFSFFYWIISFFFFLFGFEFFLLSRLFAPQSVDKSFLLPISFFLFPYLSLFPVTVCIFFWGGYALFTHCDPSALWTPRLPTDNRMLPQHSSGKPLHFYCCCFTKSECWFNSSQEFLGNIYLVFIQSSSQIVDN